MITARTWGKCDGEKIKQAKNKTIALIAPKSRFARAARWQYKTESAILVKGPRCNSDF